MAELMPFRALRFSTGAGALSQLICPPYSSIRVELQRELLAKNPNNMVHLELSDKPPAEVGETLRQWEKNGVLKQDSSPAVFLYEDEFQIQGQTRKVRGILCRVKLEDYKNSIIFPREETLSKNRIHRFNLMKATFCNFSPIYSLYQDDDRVTAKRFEMLSSFKPRFTFSEGGVTRRLWVVNDPVAINAFREDFAARKLLIAQGHHRYEAALQLRDWCREEEISGEGGDPDYVLMALTDMDNSDLTLFPFHRLIHGLKNFNQAKFLEYCGQYFDVIERENINEIEMNLDALYRQSKTAFACYWGGEAWALLILKDFSAAAKLLPGKSEAYQNLGATVLHSLLLEQGLGITGENAAQQINLSYTDSFEKAISSVREGSNQCALFLTPPRIKEIHDIAAAGELMPQKTASFYPQPAAGLVINKMGL
jgi:uncharacterized protein (DUF1015 family)